MAFAGMTVILLGLPAFFPGTSVKNQKKGRLSPAFPMPLSRGISRC
jgi:hypothetical protein